ncbi:unnamed protein product [Didymodactylos carnosus]|uniref:PDZ domain-containing protein n=2 Tax=Didymodactylos carnosus TaxID=1234261 RepID=A0A8S2HKT5_9BILA|nr:unnamed protein product [Didymodactylos carnosus]CAF3653353.1 unnamed protein product [Didymodactylos carnosus]
MAANTHSNLRLCRLCVWENYNGLGFNLDRQNGPPYLVFAVESYSPAAVGGLQMQDVILQVNREDVGNVDYETFRQCIDRARQKGPVELLVCNSSKYQEMKANSMPIDPSSAIRMGTPATMPEHIRNEYMQRAPRICEIKMKPEDTSFGFAVANGNGGSGLYIQDVVPNSQAYLAGLRKNDRILEVDGKKVEDDESLSIIAKIGKAKSKRAVKLFVADTHTYKHYKTNNQKFNPRSAAPSITNQSRSRASSRGPSIQMETNGDAPRYISEPQPSPEHDDDIRLCTINRLNESDSFGIELIYHKHEHYHSLMLVGHQSLAQRAGIKNHDRLIEINGQNVEQFEHGHVTEKILQIRKPDPLNNRLQPLELLVCDEPTYRYYKQNNLTIHRYLRTVRRITSQSQPPSLSGRASFIESTRETRLASVRSNDSDTSSSTRPSIVQQQPSTIEAIVRPPPLSIIDNYPTHPPQEHFSARSPIVNHPPSTIEAIIRPPPLSIIDNYPTHPSQQHSSLQPRTLEIRKDSRLGDGFGFTFQTCRSETPYRPFNHIITSVDKAAPRSKDLNINDYILSINNDDVETLTHEQLQDKLKQMPNNKDVAFLVAEKDAHRIHTQQLLNSLAQKQSNTQQISDNNVRTYQLQKSPNGYGFRVTYQSNDLNSFTPPQINYVAPNSPASAQGLRTGDYILRVNNRGVEHSNQKEFKELMENEKTYRTIHRTSPISNNTQNTGSRYTIPEPNRDRNDRYSSHLILPQVVPDHQRSSPTPTPTIHGSNRPLSRAAVDVIDGKLMLRFCRLNTIPGTHFGFELQSDENKRHVIKDVKHDSPAAKAGVHNEDRVVEVNNENVVNKSHKDVETLIKNASNDGLLRLLIEPSNVKAVSGTKAKTKSLTSLIDPAIYHNKGSELFVGQNTPYTNNSSRPHYNPYISQKNQESTMVRHMSTSGIDNVGSFDQDYFPYNVNDFNQPPHYSTGSTSAINPYISQQNIPLDPLPRQCLIIRDPKFRGCGFKLLESDNYDTPIITEVKQNSPARRSGLAEGDHLIYIDERNVQVIKLFNEMIQLIQQRFEERGEITLVTLTPAAYNTLKREGGYLKTDQFNYLYPNDELKEIFPPRLCKIQLLDHERDFGFTLQKANPINIKDVTKGSASYEYGLRPDDKILEINERDTTTLTPEQIVEMIDSGKRKRNINLLVISNSGYNWCQMHAVPLNSSLPFVKIVDRHVFQCETRCLYEFPDHSL